MKPSSLRARTFRERFPEGEDRARYGFAWEVARRLPCIYVLMGLGRRRCGRGILPATAHHLGRLDVEGMVPACGHHHGSMEGAPGRTEADVRRELGVASLGPLGRMVHAWAEWRLGRRDGLPEVVPWDEPLATLRTALAEQPARWSPPDDGLAY